MKKTTTTTTILFPSHATYDLKNLKHVKEIFKNNRRYYFYKKLFLVLMNKKNFWNGYLNPVEYTHDKTISQEVLDLRTGVMVGGRYPYIFKKLESGNCFQFLYLFYFKS